MKKVKVRVGGVVGSRSNDSRMPDAGAGHQALTDQTFVIVWLL